MNFNVQLKQHMFDNQGRLITYQFHVHINIICTIYLVVEKLKIIMEEIESTINAFKEQQRKS